MRSIWFVISVLAIANMMAIIALLAWLAGTQRLSLDRFYTVKDALVDPIPVQRVKDKIAAEEEAAEAERAAAEARKGTTPVSAEERLAIIRDYDRVRRAELERVQEETRRLQANLAAAAAQLERSREKFETEVESFNDMRQEIADREDDEQFAQAVKLLESQKPKQGASVLRETIEAEGMAEAIAYLDAMKERTAAKIIAEIEKDDPALAAELLNRVKQYGIDPVTGQ